jgi:predicted membrane protein
MSIEPQYPNRPRNGKVFAGLLLLGVGSVLLLQQLSWFIMPGWIFSWPMYMIVFGIYLGFKHNFRRPNVIIFLLIGTLFLADDIIPGMDIHRIFWPVVVIGFGAWLIMGRRQQHDRAKFEKYRGGNPFGGADYSNPFDPSPKPDPNFDPNAPAADAANSPYTSTQPPHTGDNWIDTVSVFGGVKRTVLSKDFKGGEIVNIFGGTDLDLTQADINGHVVIEITQLFGGIKLIVPPHWQVTSDLAAVFSNVDDKRRSMGTPISTDKVLVIKGVSIFAGVDVRSY